MLNLGDEQTLLTPSMLNTQDDISRTRSEENLRANHLNLIKGRNGHTTFLPLSPRKVGQVNKNKPGQYLTREQTNYVYKKTQLGKVITLILYSRN